MNIDHNEFKNKELIVRQTIVSFLLNGSPEFFDKLRDSDNVNINMPFLGI